MTLNQSKQNMSRCFWLTSLMYLLCFDVKHKVCSYRVGWLAVLALSSKFLQPCASMKNEE
jgi:hypothetical protein